MVMSCWHSINLLMPPQKEFDILPHIPMLLDHDHCSHWAAHAEIRAQMVVVVVSVRLLTSESYRSMERCRRSAGMSSQCPAFVLVVYDSKRSAKLC